MKKVLLILLAVIFVAMSVVACSDTGGVNEEETASASVSVEPTPEPTPARDVVPEGVLGGKRIAVVGIARSNADADYIKRMMEGCREEAAAFEFEIVTFMANSEEQVKEVLNQGMAANFDGFVLSHDPAIYSEEILLAPVESGVKVVAFDSLANQNVATEIASVPLVKIDDAMLAQASLDDMTASLGKEGARIIRVRLEEEDPEIDALYGALEESGKIATLEVVTDKPEMPEPEPAASATPEEGAEPASSEAAEETDPEEESVGQEEQSAEGEEATEEPEEEQPEPITDVSKKIFNHLPTYKTGGIDAVWCPDNTKAAEITQMLIDAGRTDVKVFSTGISSSTINLMRANPEMWVSTVASSGEEEGIISIRMMAKLLGGEEVPATVSISGKLIKAADIGDETILDNLGTIVSDWGKAADTEEYMNEPWMDKLRAQNIVPEETPEAEETQEEGEDSSGTGDEGAETTGGEDPGEQESGGEEE